MKVEALIFNVIGVFCLVMATVYGVWSREPIGTTALVLSGGLTFLVNGNMSVTVSGRGGLMVRLDPLDAERFLDGRDVVPFEMRGRPMRGWVRVSEAGYATDEQLRDWVERSVEYARTLPHH